MIKTETGFVREILQAGVRTSHRTLAITSFPGYEQLKVGDKVQITWDDETWDVFMVAKIIWGKKRRKKHGKYLSRR